MAAVSIHPSPQTSFAMSNRRTPLANVSNAANSPHRGGLVPMKRPRAANSQLEINCVQPPIKRQMLDREDGNLKSPSRKFVSQGAEGKVFARKNIGSQPTAFERRLVAARDKERQNPSKGVKYEKLSGESLDTIRQWQKHYRRVFPQFVFYFEGIPEELRNKCSRQVTALGASEEKFFSKLVTHVVTTRSIPPEIEVPNSTETITTSTSVDQHDVDSTTQTVNPSLLEKSSRVDRELMRLKTLNDRRIALADVDSKKEQSGNTDVLYRARQMNMKIWALEKLQRVISTMNDGDSTLQRGYYTRSYSTSVGIAKTGPETDLSQVLRNDRLNGPSDRDASGGFSVWKDLIPFKGPFIYIHDVEGKTRPVMVREYPKVAKRQDGAWPQFRSAALGKCPFIEDLPTKKELEREKAAAHAEEKERKAIAKEKSVTTADVQAMGPPRRSFERKPPHDAKVGANHCIGQEKSMERPSGLPITLPANPGSPRKSSEGIAGANGLRPLVMYVGREPAASGVQPSNITSAIRSQMISSTAAAPGAKAGTSKEVHELKRKVLERSNGSLSMGGMIPSLRTTGTAGSLKAVRAPITRATKSKTQGKLGNIDEVVAPSDEDGGPRKQTISGKNGGVRKAKERKRDPKPGYCENCRDKFDDFEGHVMTRKHRKFALTESNWSDLDALLRCLQRPLKQDYDFPSN